MSIVHPPLPHQPFSDSCILDIPISSQPPLYAMAPSPPLPHRHTAPAPDSPSQSIPTPSAPGALSPPAPPAPRPEPARLPSVPPVARDRLLPNDLPPTPDLSQPNHKVLFPDAIVALAPPAAEGPALPPDEQELREHLIEAPPADRAPLISLDHMVDEQMPSRPSSAASKNLVDPPPIGTVTKSRQKSTSPRPRTGKRSQTAAPGAGFNIKPSVIDTRIRTPSNVSGLPRSSPLSRLPTSAGMTKSYTDESRSSPSSRLLTVPFDATSPSSQESVPREELEAKMVLVGESNAGKTSLIRRQIARSFKEHQATIGSAMFSAKLIHAGVKVKLQVWDTAGQERHRSLAPLYYRNAGVCLIVYDVTNRKSFEAVERWLRDVKDTADADPLVLVAGTKTDEVDNAAEACTRVRRWLNGEPDAPPFPPLLHKDALEQSSSNASRNPPKNRPPKPITPPRSFSFDGLSSMTSAATSASSDCTTSVSPPPLSSSTSNPPPTGGSVPFPKSARTNSSTSRPMSPLGSTASSTRPKSPGPGLTTFPAYSNRPPPTSAMHTALVVGKSTANPTSPVRPNHRSQSSVASIAQWLGYTISPPDNSAGEPTRAVSNLMQLADEHRLSSRSSSGHDSGTVEDHRRPSSNLGRAATSPLAHRSTLNVTHDNEPRRRSAEWTSRMSAPWTSAISPADALSEFSEGIKKKQSGELLSASISTLPPRTTRARAGSLGRDPRLYGYEPEPEPLWGVDVAGVRVGECSALSGEGVDDLFGTIGALLVQRKDAIDKARTLRRKDSIMLTDAKEPEVPRGYCCV